MFVKPAEHPTETGVILKVRHPRTHALLLGSGEEVPETRYWLRRLSQGDVVKAEPAAAAARPEAAGHEGSAT